MHKIFGAFVLLVFLFSHQAEADEALTLTEAEDLISGQDPAFERFTAQAEALDNGAIANGQLPDPKLRIGLVNLPTDSWDFDREPMTQAIVGLSQAFPPGNTLSLKSARTKDMASRQRAALSAKSLEALLAVRTAWLEAYYWSQAIDILEESKASLQNVIGATASRFATGLQKSEDLVRTELELSVVEDRALDALRQLEGARVDLIRWIGTDGQRPIDHELPELPPPGNIEALRANLVRHPLTEELDAEIAVRRRDIELARQRYWPEFSVDAAYGYRDQDRTGRNLPDFASLVVNMSVPLFPWSRQDKEVARSRREADSARYTRDARLLELQRMLEAAWSDWLRFGDRINLYKKALAAQAEQNLDASLLAYQADVTDFSTLMRAQLMEIDTRLRELRLRVDKGKAQARLLYLKGTGE